MKRILLRLAYDGTGFYGWQTQKSGRTVQQTIETALFELAGAEIPVTGSGRTDSGVHALRQYAHFDLPLKMTPEQLCKALRTKLPHDIGMLEAFEVSNDFNARYDAFKRSYRYIITRNRTPFNRFYKSFIPRLKLDDESIKAALPYFLGKHDFTSFSKLNPDLKHNFCDLQQFDVSFRDEDIIFEISANRFLHNMVRRLVGTVVNISHTETDPKIITELIERKNPSHRLIQTAPSQGLYLKEVHYPEEKFL